MHGRRLQTTLALYLLFATGGWALAAWYAPPAPWRHPRPWLPLASTEGLILAIGSGTFVGLLVARLTRWMVPRLPWARRLHETLRAAVLPLEPGATVWLAIGSALGEELLFRGALQPTMGWLASSLLFGWLHGGTRRALWPWAAWATAMGLLFGALYAASGWLLAPLLAHALVNYLNLRYLAAFEPPPPAKGSSG